jgi:hypothetical protein
VTVTIRLQFAPVLGSKFTEIVAAGRSADESLAAVSLKMFAVQAGMTQLVVPSSSVESAAAILAPSRAAFWASWPV